MKQPPLEFREPIPVTLEGRGIYSGQVVYGFAESISGNRKTVHVQTPDWTIRVSLNGYDSQTGRLFNHRGTWVLRDKDKEILRGLA